MHPMVNIAVSAARGAGDLIMRFRDRVDSISIEKKEQHDFVTSIDREAQALIMRVLSKSFPDHRIVGEESANSHERLNHEPTWIVDPLDGTTNYIHGIGHYAVSIAFMDKGRLENGVIYDPMRQELFTATRGQGAMLDNRRLRVSETPLLKEALLATGFPFRNRDLVDEYLRGLGSLYREVMDVRRTGSATLDLAYVAAGRLDGFWEYHLYPWDLAAGVLLVREAGGYVVDFQGGEGFLESGNVLASNAKIFKGFLQKIQPCFKNPKD